MLRMLSAALVAVFLAAPALAQDGVVVSDAYARVSPHSAAVFLVMENHSDQDDRLLSVGTDVAGKAALHTHREDATGVMQMLSVEGGIVIPAGLTAELARGGDHVMLTDLSAALKDGDSFALTLTFEHSEAVTVTVTVDNDRKPEGHGQHGTHSP